jgi:hypothetical protein
VFNLTILLSNLEAGLEHNATSGNVAARSAIFLIVLQDRPPAGQLKRPAFGVAHGCLGLESSEAPAGSRLLWPFTGSAFAGSLAGKTSRQSATAILQAVHSARAYPADDRGREVRIVDGPSDPRTNQGCWGFRRLQPQAPARRAKAAYCSSLRRGPLLARRAKVVYCRFSRRASLLARRAKVQCIVVSSWKQFPCLGCLPS